MTRAQAIKAAIAKAEEGVDYSPKGGAKCPVCGKRCKVVSSPEWFGGLKVRYHKCGNPLCLLSATGRCIKSVQRDVA